MPYFSKFLSDTDVKKQMAIESKFVEHLPKGSGGRTVPLYVTDVKSGKVWEFEYYQRKDGHPKPIFQGDWQEYRRHKGLKVDDKITFNSHDDGSFSILAEKKIKLLGQTIWERV